MTSVSVVILATRPRLLARCLESLSRALPGDAECLVVLNGSEECAAAAAPFGGRVPGLRLLRAAPRSLGGSRNAAVAEARGAWVCFLDDDVTVPRDYFAVLAQKARLFPEAAAIGGPNLTPEGSGIFERCCGWLLGSPLCAGPAARRNSGFDADAWTDESGLILCNLAVRRAALGEDPFDPELVRNEENLLLARLALSGARALHAPSLYVRHARRPTLYGFLRQCFLSGRGRLQMTLKLPSSLRPYHLAPLLPTLGLAASALAPSSVAPLAGLYLGLAAANAAWIAWRRREGAAGFAWTFFLYPCAHLAYGAGLLCGAAWAALRWAVPERRAFEEAAHAG